MQSVSIIILGGGTAGWITASWLIKQFGANAGVRISLVESKSIGILGVGEATLPSLIPFLRLLGLSETEFMRATKASFKQGILYKNWMRAPKPGYPDHTYFHPFDHHDIIAFNPGQWWLAHRAGTSGADYANDMSAQFDIAMANKAPRTPEAADYKGEIGYAYHFDAELFAAFLANWCKARGVHHIQDDVLSAERTEDGRVLAVKAKEAGRLAGDIFVDCSGFKGLLINKSLGKPFESYTGTLFCDQAVAIRVPRSEEENIRPYTTTTAMEHGWIWEIDLQGRRGVGYVHSSRHCSFDEAEDRLRRHVGPAAEDLSARRLHMRVGRTTKTWDRNVISIGLSAGFIEPLESTGIYLVEVGARLLATALAGILPLIAQSKRERQQVNGNVALPPDHSVEHAFEAVAQGYNRRIKQLFEEIRDFIKIHYSLSQRADSSFWLENRKADSIPDSLAQMLSLWDIRPPSNVDFPNRFSLFNESNWLYVMLGMGWRPANAIDNSFLSREVGEALMHIVDQLRQKAIATLPNQRDFLNRLVA